MARKAFHYMEVTFPQSVINEYPNTKPVGIMRSLLLDFIAETDSKEGKVIREFVYNDIKTYDWNGNVGAYSFEFLNERNRKTYFQARESFGTWLAAKGVVTSYDLSHDIPAQKSSVVTEPDYDDTTYYTMAKKFIFIDIPESRGFESEE